MPAPGDQHLMSGGKTIVNPFEEAKPRISEYTAQEIATLQSRLERQLGPEYISSRAGPSGQKVHYMAAEKCISLANEVFGFNGWSSQIMNVQVDFVDEHPQTLRVSLGLSVIIRVTLRDGTFHEDLGYGHIENCKGKAAAFEKAKKEGTTDALKRALKNFGNVLGNCLYDKDYLAKVTKVKVEKPRWDVANLHRHADYVPPKIEPRTEAQEVPDKEKKEEKNVGEGTSIIPDDVLEDDFGDFDEADFSVPDQCSHPDEVTLPEQRLASHQANTAQNMNHVSRPTPNINKGTIAPQQAVRHPNGVQNSNNGPAQQPQTPKSGFVRSTTAPGQVMRPPRDIPRPPQPVQPVQPVVAGRVLNQPSRTSLASAPASPAPRNKPSDVVEGVGLPPPGKGFSSARTANMAPESAAGGEMALSHMPNLPAFNPHSESPSIPKTPGVDHRSSKPLARDVKHLAKSARDGAPGGMGRGNVMNPQLDGARRIGAPGGGMSPMQNRGSYKPPMIKRPIDSGGGPADRAPLGDLGANDPIGVRDGGGGDAKRQRLHP